MPFDFISLTLIDPKERVVRLHILESEQPLVGKPPESTPFEQTPTIAALESRRPYYIPDTAEESRFPVIRDLLRANGIQSACILPLFTAQREIGGLHFGSLTRNAYSEEDIEFMGQVARQVAVAVDNALNSEAAVAFEEQLAHERDRLRTLLEVNNAVVSCLETRELFQAISASLRRSFGLDYASLLIHDAEAGALRMHTLDFPDGSGAIREDAIVALDDSLAGYVFRTRQGRVFSLEQARSVSANTGRAVRTRGHSVALLRPADLAWHGARHPECRLAAARPLLRATTSASSPRWPARWPSRWTTPSPTSASRCSTSGWRRRRSTWKTRSAPTTGSRRSSARAARLKATLKQLETVAPTDSTVLIYGETGTGKELLARAIHDLSSRRQATFVKLNCAAIPTGLLESELFGHEKGAFTGAIAQRIGRFELANRGTMFLDEVGEIPLELQSKLLRVLQEREFERLGSSRTIRTDARLVAATNRDLAQLVEQRLFRADLYYRLNVFPITAPPLRERRDDIPLLVRYFVQQYARRMNRRITSIPTESMDALVRYHWPGNIRELQNFIERAVILSTGSALQVPVRELKRGPVGAQRRHAGGRGAGSHPARAARCRRQGGRGCGRRRQARHEAHHAAGEDAQAGDRYQVRGMKSQSMQPGIDACSHECVVRVRAPRVDLHYGHRPI